MNPRGLLPVSFFPALNERIRTQHNKDDAGREDEYPRYCDLFATKLAPSLRRILNPPDLHTWKVSQYWKSRNAVTVDYDRYEPEDP